MSHMTYLRSKEYRDLPHSEKVAIVQKRIEERKKKGKDLRLPSYFLKAMGEQ